MQYLLKLGPQTAGCSMKWGRVWPLAIIHCLLTAQRLTAESQKHQLVTAQKNPNQMKEGV